MKRVAIVALAVGVEAFVLVNACDPAADVVARSADGGTPNDAAEAGPPLPDAAWLASGCGPVPTTFDVITASGQVLAVDLTSADAQSISRPECTITSGTTMAISRTGNLVLADQQGFLFVAVQTNAGWECTKSLFVAVPNAMTFHYSYITGEQLYALLGTRLVTVNTGSLAITTIASLAPVPNGTIRGLASTADARLVLFVEQGTNAVIDEIDPATGTVTSILTITDPDPPSAFLGAIPTATGYELVFGENVWTYVTAVSAFTAHAALMTSEAGVVASVGNWPCAP